MGGEKTTIWAKLCQNDTLRKITPTESMPPRNYNQLSSSDLSWRTGKGELGAIHALTCTKNEKLQFCKAHKNLEKYHWSRQMCQSNQDHECSLFPVQSWSEHNQHHIGQEPPNFCTRILHLDKLALPVSMSTCPRPSTGFKRQRPCQPPTKLL